MGFRRWIPSASQSDLGCRLDRRPSNFTRIALLIAVAAASACDTELPTDVAHTEEAPATAVGQAALSTAGDGGSRAPGTRTATLGPPPNEWTRIGPFDLEGGPFDEPTLVEIELRGLLQSYHAYPESSAGRPHQVYGPGGFWGDWDCRLSITVIFSERGRFGPCKGPYDEMQEVYTTRIVVQGTGNARRSPGMTPWLARCGSVFGVPCYTYSGSQTVTVTPVSDQLRVEADTSHVRAGTPVTFTASTIDGTPLVVREWIWVEEAPGEEDASDGYMESATGGTPESGEDAAAVSSGDLDRREETVCGTDETCTHAPARSGTMYVRAVVGGVVQQAGVGVAVEDSDAELILICTPETVVRIEQPVTCAASATPAEADLEIVRWTFRGGDAPDIVENTRSRTWAGPMAISGTVHVEALVNGEPKFEEVEVTVTPRHWPDNLPNTATEYVCPAPGVPDCPLAYPPGFQDDLGATLPYPPRLLPREVNSIEVGPNKGWSYVVNPLIRFDEIRIYLNRVLFEATDSFYRRGTCTQPELLATVRAHEQVHVRFFLEAAADDPLNARVERWIRYEPLDQFRERIHGLAVELAQDIREMQAAEDVIPLSDPRRQSFPSLNCSTGMPSRSGRTTN